MIRKNQFKSIMAWLLTFALAWSTVSPAVFAMPGNAIVRDGDAQVDWDRVIQQSDFVVIDWQSFSIATPKSTWVDSWRPRYAFRIPTTMI